MANPTRRGVLGALLGSGAAGAALSPLADILETAAPVSGRAWRGRYASMPETVDSPHGDATVTYDDHHVPHVEADDEAAAYFAVGFVHAADRLFQMDLTRRLMDGRLAAIVGGPAVESDRFHAELDFRGGDAATADALAGSRTESMIEAYAAGVTRYTQVGPTPLEFDLLDYDPEPWDSIDTLLAGQQIAWSLTGGFQTLRRAVLRDSLAADTYRRLYEAPFDHGAPILRNEGEGAIDGFGGGSDTRRGINAGFVDALSKYEPRPPHGSNHWAVSGAHTESGAPMLAYDPHLTLMAPPVWYEQHIVVGDVDVRGATLPGIPFVVVGENDHGAWGFTNAGADVIDFYTYETDGSEYRYRDGWRAFETSTRSIEVADGDDREVEVRKTVHGPYVERSIGGDTRAVSVSWTGLTGTREPEAIYEFSHTTGVDDYRDSLMKLDVPTQNALYVDENEVYYKITGRIPIRRVDGDVVRGDRIFDGSTGEAEWEGFTPFGQSSWSGFVPFEDKPGVRGVEYLGTANQRPLDDPTYPIGQSYASGFRGRRIYERLDRRIDATAPVDRAFMASLQRDTLDIRARMLVPAILSVRERLPAAAEPWLAELAQWDFRMDRESAAALFFERFYDHYRVATWHDDFETLGLDEAYWPKEWTLVTLPPDDPFFDGNRDAVIERAVRDAIEDIETRDWSVYGDRKRTTIDHQLGGQVDGLNYPRYPTDGTAYTLFNVHATADHGSSWRQISPVAGESLSILPGGQDGDYFSPHYADQLERWADGGYKRMAFAIPTTGDRIRFERGTDGA